MQTNKERWDSQRTNLWHLFYDNKDIMRYINSPNYYASCKLLDIEMHNGLSQGKAADVLGMDLNDYLLMIDCDDKYTADDYEKAFKVMKDAGYKTEEIGHCE